MREAAHIVVRASAKFVLPIFLLAAFYLAVSPDGGGLQGGLSAALAIALHSLVFGPAATRRALPPFALRLAAILGIVVLIASAAIEWRAGAAPLFLASFGLFLTTGASGALVFAALAGRAHALRDEDW